MESISFYKKLDLKKYIGRKHLDIGCGEGEFTYNLAKDFPKSEIIGIDMDNEKINFAKNNYLRKNLRFLKTSKISGKYDSVSLIKVIHEVKNLKKTLKEAHESLNANGKIIIYDFRKGNKKMFKKLYLNKPRKIKFKAYYKKHNKWNLNGFREIMKKSGFHALKVKPDQDLFLIYVGRV